MRFITVLALMFCFGACKQNQLKVKFFKAKNFIIADTSVEANQFLSFGDYTCDCPIYYIGAQLDTIKIGKEYRGGRTQWVNNFSIPWNRKYSNKTLTIFVDTFIKTNAQVEYFSYDTERSSDSIINYNSFLFSIKNISDSTIYMGRTFSVFFINREAKNRNGDWVKVDEKLSDLGICGSAQPTIILKPGELVLAKVKRYKGTFVTDFRLVFGYGNNVVYSNVFRDSIDERTLQKSSANNQ